MRLLFRSDIRINIIKIISLYLNEKQTMSYNLFTENMKLADLLLSNYRLLYVFPYFDISLGFGETTVKQACDERNISPHFFLLVCNVYTYADYVPNHATLQKVSVEEMIVYLRKSHQDYINHRIPHIISHVYELVSSSPKSHGDILVKFCEKYRDDLNSHFRYEEENVYPHIFDQQKGVKGLIEKIERSHSRHQNLETALHDLKNIIIKYIPQNNNIEETRTNVLIYLSLFEADINAHTRLEDKILMSLIKYIENNLT